MDSHISLIGSVVIGSLLLLSILNFQSDVKIHSFQRTNDRIFQNAAVGTIEVLLWDFRHIGSGVDTSGIMVADSNNFIYRVDLNADSIIDTVRYFVSDTSAASATPNPHDRLFFRLVNGEQNAGDAIGVTDFKLKYFNSLGNETTILREIKTIEVTLEMESTTPDDNGDYTSFFWREKVSPPNLQFKVF